MIGSWGTPRFGLTETRILPSANAPTSPTAAPASVSVALERTMIHEMSRTCAPNASRIPNSGVRRNTVCAMTPWIRRRAATALRLPAGRSLRGRMLVSGSVGSLLAVTAIVGLLGITNRWRGDLSAAIDALVEEQLIADRISAAVMRQFLAVSSLRTRESGTHREEFAAAGQAVYEQLRLYLFRDLTPADRLQLEVVKEEHQRLEVAAARTADFFKRGEAEAGEASFDVMSGHASRLLQALDGFVRMREADFERLRGSQQRAFWAIYALAAAFGAVMLVGAIAFGRFLLRRVDRPLSQLTAVARRIEEGDLQARVTGEHDAEFSALAVTFNKMAASLGDALAAARRSEESFRYLFINNPLPMWVYELETTRFLEVSEAAVHHYGYSREEFLAMRLADIRPPEDAPLLEADLVKERPTLQTSGGWRHRLKDGRIINVEITSHLLTFGGRRAALAVAPDVSRREQLEAQLRQSQKMEAVAQLTGGIAHDFNNLLSVILGNSQIALEELSETDPARKDIAEVYDAGQRAAVLTRQLLAFSRKQVLDPKVTNLNSVLDGMEGMLPRLLGEDVEIQIQRADGLGSVMADAGQLELAIVNLAVNARDAMAHGGKLTFETANVDLDEAYAEEHIAIEPGQYVRLSVTDTGSGMDAETRSRVFEPFFTTKEKGKGTGLGLSMVYGIVKQSGGNIWVYSEPGQGTTFKIYLQRVDAPASTPTRPQPGRGATGHETILIVEDEAAVRRTAARMLERAGYTVLTAASGPEALRLCEERQGAIALLLTDVVMPQMNGRELEQRLTALLPNLKVLFASGYADNAIVHRGVLDPGTHFIGKPFTSAALTRKVREVLDQG